jgi:hypothetical protein
LPVSTFPQDQERDVGTRHQRRLRFQVAHALAGTHERVGLIEWNLPKRIGCGNLLLHSREMLLNGLFHVAAGKGFHHDATNPQSNDHLDVAQIGRARQHNDWKVRFCAPNMGQKRQ